MSDDLDLARIADQLASTNQVLLRIADALDDLAEAQWPDDRLRRPPGRPSQQGKQ